MTQLFAELRAVLPAPRMHATRATVPYRQPPRRFTGVEDCAGRAAARAGPRARPARRRVKDGVAPRGFASVASSPRTIAVPSAFNQAMDSEA